MSRPRDQIKKAGDYVLASKYEDGDPGDHFAVGFYSHSDTSRGASDLRHVVADGEGKPFRANGFRRVEKISRERGEWLVSRLSEIELGSKSVWWWKRQKIDVITHQCPPNGSGIMPCCGRTPFDVPVYHRVTEDLSLVTCPSRKGTKLESERPDG